MATIIEYKLTSILQQCNAYKIKGLSAAEIFKYLLTNVFELDITIQNGTNVSWEF